MTRALSFVMVLLAFAPALLAQPRFRNAGATLIAEQVTNKVVQSGEWVTVGLALKNVGDAVASNLIATISGAGVSNPDPASESYGLLAPCAPSVMREFTFTANGASDSLLFVNLDLEDSGRAFGKVTFRFRIGPQVTSTTNSSTIVIPTRGTAAPYPSSMLITNAPGSIAKVSVTLSNLTHTFPEDLDILLVSPSGDGVMLMSDACGGVDLENRTLTFSDDAEQLLPDVGLPVAEAYKPTNHSPGDLLPPPAPVGPYASVLSAFNGRMANGDWKLFIQDNSPGDGGALYDGWLLTITTFQPLDSAPTLTFLGRTNDMIRFSVSGRPGRGYAIETSPDPVQAFPLETFVMPVSGTRTFEFPLESEDRFFRAVTDP